ncbi:ATP-dependent DNA helicase [Nocardioides flavescens]|uniref:ATP-dependent DNA helicase n=1 Tax=Nocardioides flavescens TaxID=2691959 RepID=UPI00301DAB19
MIDSVAAVGDGVRIETPRDLAAAMKVGWEASDQQWAAISAPLTPAVVIAGAGSGKTTLMAARVVHLVLTGQVRPDQVLGLTFTTKAASELRSRIRTALLDAGALDAVPVRPGEDGVDGNDTDDVLEPTVLTYNAYAAGLLTDHGLRIGHEPDTRVITDAARYQLGARVVDRYDGVVALLSDHPETVIQNLLALDSAMSEHLVTPDDVRAFDARARAGFVAAREEEAAGKARKTYLGEIDKALSAVDRRGELLGLVAAYRRLKADLGLMDFSDQIELGARLAREEPEVGALERDKFAVVLLDEYQDTSVAQAVMLSRLFGGGHAVTAVGDPNQAIYGWRGASVSNILNFADTFPARDADGGRAGVPTYPLTVNRRSDRRILEVANRLARPLYEEHASVAELQAAPGAAPGRVTTTVFETHREELAALVRGVHTSHEAGDAWSDIGVLVRDNAHAAEVFDALTHAGVPVEIVGLSGLLRLPEVAEIVAVLHLMHDVTANAALLSLLAGPRWSVGPRDLRLLSRRAEELAGARGRSAEPADLDAHLVQIADGVDPAEITCLDDALVDPGEGPDHAYSPEARERFALLAGELRMLRSHVGEPLLDVVRRIIDTTGVDVELASAVSPAAAARRDNLDLFVKAVADFQAVDGDVSLAALLAYLTAEDDQGNGLDIATPTAADSVKLLTVHRSKGLEWATVFLVGVCETRFPSNRSRTLWTTSPATLPAPLRGDAVDLPQLDGYDKAALDAYRAATRDHDALEELRLGYVAFTRAAHALSVTSYCWTPRTTPYGPSPYQQVVRDLLAEWGEPAPAWLDKPVKGTPNPYDDEDPSRPWPTPYGEEAARRLAAAELVGSVDPGAEDSELDVIEAARAAEWDDEVERLLTEARADRSPHVEVVLPSSLSATALVRLREDPDAFARELARPMPRPPSRAARFGTLFHAWVEARFDQQPLLDPDDLPGRSDHGIDDDADLDAVVSAFEAGPFADRVPLAVEAPFALVLAGQVVRGRIDAVYDEPTADGPGFLLVDWKTSRSADADPLQLALYRVAWAELRGVPLERVRAAFHYVRTGRTVEPELPDRQALETLLS